MDISRTVDLDELSGFAQIGADDNGGGGENKSVVQTIASVLVSIISSTVVITAIKQCGTWPPE